MILIDTLPVHAPITRLRHVREYRVGHDGIHGDRIGRSGSARSDAKEAGLRVDGAQLPILIESHPSDIVTDALYLIPW